MNPSPQPSLLTVDDVARMIQVSVRTVWRWRSEGRIPQPVEIAGSIRWVAGEIEKWIAEGCQNLAKRQNANRRS